LTYQAATYPEDGETWWQANPMLAHITVFKQWKTKLKTKSHKIFCAIYQVYDPKSPLRASGLATEELKQEIEVNYLKDKNFKWETYAELIEAYQNFCTSPIEKQLQKWYDMLDERTKYLDSLK